MENSLNSLELTLLIDGGFNSCESEVLDYEFDESDMFEEDKSTDSNEDCKHVDIPASKLAKTPVIHTVIVHGEQAGQEPIVPPQYNYAETSFVHTAMVHAEHENQTSVFHPNLCFVVPEKQGLPEVPDMTFADPPDSVYSSSHSDLSSDSADQKHIVKAEIERTESFNNSSYNTDGHIMINTSYILESYNQMNSTYTFEPTESYFGQDNGSNFFDQSFMEDLDRIYSYDEVFQTNEAISQFSQEVTQKKQRVRKSRKRPVTDNPQAEYEVRSKRSKKQSVSIPNTNASQIDDNSKVKAQSTKQQLFASCNEFIKLGGGKPVSKVPNPAFNQKKCQPEHGITMVKAEYVDDYCPEVVPSALLATDEPTCDENDLNVSNVNSDQPRKLDKKIKVEPGVFHSVSKSIKAENLKQNVKKTNSSKAIKEEKLSTDRKTRLAVKIADIKVEHHLRNNLLMPALVLERLSSKIIPGVTVKLESIKPKDEFIDRKPVSLPNISQMPKAKVVLKRLTAEELRCPSSLLSRVKSEFNETVSPKSKDFVHRYCCKCKSVQVDRQGVSKTKFCEACNTLLVFLCVKCNEKYFSVYYHLRRHLKACRGTGEAKPVNLDSIVLHRCTDCTFQTAYPKAMASHIRKKGHKANGEVNVSNLVKNPMARVKTEVTGIINATERYCSTCNEPRLSKTRRRKQSCRGCRTPLHLRCLKCSLICESYDDMVNHLQSTCVPNVMEQHDTSSSKSKLDSTQTDGKFNCELCTFKSFYSISFERHMKVAHKK